MKTRRRILNLNAVSAVIGVIIMVAITVAMAAVAYAYFTGMIGEQKMAAPAIDFVKSDSEKTVTISTADVDTNWKDINITFNNATDFRYITKNGLVNAGDIIDFRSDQNLTGTVTITFTHIPSNSLLASYTIDNV
jgi:FlaG/FlaF family flagellin (archaellin)